MKNLTLSIPDDLLEASRSYAKEKGTTLNQLVRDLLKKYTIHEAEKPMTKFRQQTDEISILTKTNSWGRDEIYDRKIFS